MHDRKTQKQIERTKGQNEKKNLRVRQSLEKRIFQEINRNTLSKLNVVPHPVLRIAYTPRAYTHTHTLTNSYLSYSVQHRRRCCRAYFHAKLFFRHFIYIS